MKIRLLHYLLLITLTIVTPYLTTMVCIIITGDRYEGMAIAVIPGIIIPQLIFGLVFIKSNWLIKILWTIIVATIIYGIVFLMIRFEVIKTNLDLYGFWDIAVSNLIAGLLIWEIFFQINIHLIKLKRAHNRPL